MNVVEAGRYLVHASPAGHSWISRLAKRGWAADACHSAIAEGRGLAIRDMPVLS